MKLLHLLTALGVLCAIALAQPAHATAIADATLIAPVIISSGVNIITPPVMLTISADASSDYQGTVTETSSLMTSMVAEATQTNYELDARVDFQWNLSVSDPATETASFDYNIIAGDALIPPYTLTCPGLNCGMEGDNITFPLFIGLGTPTTIDFIVSIKAIAVSPVPGPGSLPLLATGLMIFAGIGVRASARSR